MRSRSILIRRMFTAGAGVVVLGILIAGAFGVAAQQRTPIFTPKPLTNATPDEVSSVAIAYTSSHYQVLTTPQVLLSRTTSKAEVTKLGLGDLTINTIEHPSLTLVILKGDFGYGSNPGLADPATLASLRFKYIGYVFDQWRGVPTLAIASSDGGIFRQALNDPTLPLVPPIPIAPPLPTPAHPLHYGDIAPTVTLPTISAKPKP